MTMTAKSRLGFLVLLLLQNSPFVLRHFIHFGIGSQVCLSMQLGFAVWPLMRFTSEEAKMGEFANRIWIKILGWTTAGIIIVLNVKLLLDTFLPDAVLKSLYDFFHIPAPTQ